MKRPFLSILLFIIGAHTSFGQQINIYKTFGGYRFEKDSVSISPKMVLRIFEDNPQAYAEFKIAKRNYDAAGALRFAGGAMIVVPLATAIIGGDPEWGFAGGGVALLLASIPFNSAFQHRALNALDIYNGTTSSSKGIKINFRFTGTGGILLMRF